MHNDQTKKVLHGTDSDANLGNSLDESIQNLLPNDFKSPKKSRDRGRVSRIFNESLSPIKDIRDATGRLIQMKAGASINILIN